MSEKWREAAEHCRSQKEERGKQETAKAQAVEAAEQLKQKKDYEIQQVALELESFLQSREGQNAKELLGATGEYLLIAQCGGPVYYTSNYYALNCRGLLCVVAHQSLPRIIEQPTKVTTTEVISQAVLNQDKIQEAAELIPWVRERLDLLAEKTLAATTK